MEKYRSIFVIGIIVIISLVGIVFAQSTEIVVEEKGFNLISWIKGTFGLSTFSIVGDSRQCDNYPSKTLYYSYDELMMVSGSTGTNWPCPSENGLIDVFDGKWNPFGEWNQDFIAYCGDADGCIVEVYCCPHPECTSDSQCISWYGTGSECIISNADDPQIDYMEGSALKSTFNYCSLPSEEEITCYYYPDYGSSCLTRTYIGESECPSTYYGYVLYSSKSECENMIDSCSAGETKCEGTYYYTCSNENWVSEGQVDGKCGYSGGLGDIRISAGPYVAAPSFTGGLTTIEVQLKNYGTKTETINLEAGFYSPEYATNVAELFSTFPLFSSVPVPNCNPAEEFVETREVTLTPGVYENIEIVVSPYASFVTYGVGTHDLRVEKPIWFVGLYKECLGGYVNEAGTTGRGVMFDYGDYEMQCPLFNSDILCNGEKAGTCGVNTFEIEYKCDITSTVDVVNGTEPSASINKTTLSEAKKIAISKEAISTSTSADLLASSCLSSSECILPAGDEEEYEARCISIAKLRDEGVLTEADTENFFGNAKKIATGTAIGASAGIIGCFAAGIIGTVATGGTAAPILAPALIGCATAGGLLGGSATAIVMDITESDSLLKELKAENANAVGICTKKPKSGFGEFFEGLAFIDVTGDGIKNGTDGMIIVGVVLLLGLLLLRR